jgi:FMN phosphatase YigB (HAD superfamily)
MLYARPVVGETNRYAYDLLVLDYAGVCTRSHHEILAARQPPSDQPVERAEGLAMVRSAQAAGMRVVVLSNEIDQAWIPNSPLLSSVDTVLACTDNGILKPDRRAYQRALLATGCTANRALFVDDDADNVRGARGAGLDAIVFDTNDPAGSWIAVATACGLTDASPRPSVR